MNWRIGILLLVLTGFVRPASLAAQDANPEPVQYEPQPLPGDSLDSESAPESGPAVPTGTTTTPEPDAAPATTPDRPGLALVFAGIRANSPTAGTALLVPHGHRFATGVGLAGVEDGAVLTLSRLDSEGQRLRLDAALTADGAPGAELRGGDRLQLGERGWLAIDADIRPIGSEFDSLLPSPPLPRDALVGVNRLSLSLGMNAPGVDARARIRTEELREPGARETQALDADIGVRSPEHTGPGVRLDSAFSRLHVTGGDSGGSDDDLTGDWSLVATRGTLRAPLRSGRNRLTVLATGQVTTDHFRPQEIGSDLDPSAGGNRARGSFGAGALVDGTLTAISLPRQTLYLDATGGGGLTGTRVGTTRDGPGWWNDPSPWSALARSSWELRPDESLGLRLRLGGRASERDSGWRADTQLHWHMVSLDLAAWGRTPDVARSGASAALALSPSSRPVRLEVRWYRSDEREPVLLEPGLPPLRARYGAPTQSEAVDGTLEIQSGQLDLLWTSAFAFDTGGGNALLAFGDAGWTLAGGRYRVGVVCGWDGGADEATALVTLRTGENPGVPPLTGM